MQGPGAAGAAGAVVGLLLGLACGVLIATLIGAIILRAAVSAFNKLSQPENQVPEPDFGKAMLMAFVAAIVNGVVGFGIGIVFGTALAAANAPPMQVQLIVQAISLPISLLVLAGTITLLLPTSFGRALLISLLYLAIGIAVAIVIGGFVLIVALIFSAAR